LRDHQLLENGWTRCVIAFDSLDEAYVDLLRLGGDVEVLEPEESRVRIAENARAVTALYA